MHILAGELFGDRAFQILAIPRVRTPNSNGPTFGTLKLSNNTSGKFWNVLSFPCSFGGVVVVDKKKKNSVSYYLLGFRFQSGIADLEAVDKAEKQLSRHVECFGPGAWSILCWGVSKEVVVLDAQVDRNFKQT